MFCLDSFRAVYFWAALLCSLDPRSVRVVRSEILSNVAGTGTGNEIQFEHHNNAKSFHHECRLRPVVHVLQHDGCIHKPIPSFACVGTCSSYVQVSNSKFWQVERSCNCCQEAGEREATISLFCPGQVPKFRQVTTRAPVDCICRPCSAVDEQIVKPQEIAEMLGE